MQTTFPNYQECMLPVLEVLANREDLKLKDLTTLIADRLNLTEMIEHNIGVTTSRTYSIKRVDDDYFSEEDG